MSDYRQRFEEVFPSIMGKHKVKNFPKEAFYDILTFMDEVVSEERTKIHKEYEMLIRWAARLQEIITSIK